MMQVDQAHGDQAHLDQAHGPTRGRRRARLRSSGLVAILALVGAALALTSCSTASTTVTLIPTRPGVSSTLVRFESWLTVGVLEVRFTSNTGRTITVDNISYQDGSYGTFSEPNTIEDAADAPWTAVGPIYTGGIRGALYERTTLRLTTDATTDVPVSIEARVRPQPGAPAGSTFPISPFGSDCGRVAPRTDLTAVDLSGLDLTGCVIPGVTLDPAKLTGTHLDVADLSDATFIPGTLTRTTFDSAVLTGATFAGVHLVDVRLAADLTGVSFDHATLEDANLTGAHLDGTNLSTATLTRITSGAISGTPLLPSKWSLRHGFLVGPTANLNNAQWPGEDLHGVDLSGGSLVGVDLSGANLSGADLTGADLHGINLAGANLGGAELAGADLTGIRSSQIVGTPASLPTGFIVARGWLVGPDTTLSQADLSGLDLHGRDLHGVQFDQVDLHGADLTGADLTGASLTNSNVAGTQFAGATLTNIWTGALTGTPASLPTGWRFLGGGFVGNTGTLAGGDLHGLDLHGLDLHGFSCSDCTMTGTNLTGADLSGGSFRDSLNGANLTNANLSGALIFGSMQNATIAGTILTGASLSWVDMTGSTGTPIYAGVDFSWTVCPDGQYATPPAQGLTTCQGHPWP